MTEAEEKARQEYLGCALLLGANDNKFGHLIEETKNAHLQKHDKYPKTLLEAYTILSRWENNYWVKAKRSNTQHQSGNSTDNSNQGERHDGSMDNMGFATIGENNNNNTTGRSFATVGEFPNITCYNCGMRDIMHQTAPTHATTHARTNKERTTTKA